LECEALPLPQRNEMQRINHVRELDAKLRLTVDEWDALRKYAGSRTYPALKSFAAGVLEHKREVREFHIPAVEKIAYSDLKEVRKEELRELLYNDFLRFFEREGTDELTIRQLGRIEKEILKSFITCHHLQVIPDLTWSKMYGEAMVAAAADYKEFP
jgi:hypothetical protein